MGKLKIFTEIENLITMEGALNNQGRHVQDHDLGVILKGAMVVLDDKIVWTGSQKNIPKPFYKRPHKIIPLNAKTVLPGFIESHTHTVFAGDRAQEFEMRNQGVSYQEIAAKGGGILSTMHATRRAKSSQLQNLFQTRVIEFLKQGVTTLEVKSGYALNLKDEIKILKVASKASPLKVVTTFLGAHAKPPEFSNYEDYLIFLADEVLPKIKKQKLSHRVDIFVEEGFFTKGQSQKYLQKAKALGFDICIHADQLSLSGGTDLAIQLGALSADHLIQITDSEIHSLAQSDVTCVLLPAADLYMRCAYPPARKLIDAGARIALATDFNPGSSPTQDLALVGLLARLEMKMTLAEVLSAYTVGAAYALNVQNNRGALLPGYCADFLCTESSWTTLFYSVGKKVPSSVYINGLMHYKI